MNQPKINFHQHLYRLASLLLSVFLISGCLYFGKDEETTHPNPQQVLLCRKAMYLNPNLDINPLGFKLIGSGIDDAIWFKFRTKAKSIHEIFDLSQIDPASFSEGVILGPEKGLKWWDVSNKKFFGGQIPLPNAKYMNVGLKRQSNGFVVYIFWYET